MLRKSEIFCVKATHWCHAGGNYLAGSQMASSRNSWIPRMTNLNSNIWK